MAEPTSISDPLPEEQTGGGVGAARFTVAEARQAKRLTLVLGIITVFFFLELGGAILARSNVLKADALHLLMDVLALTMSLVAMRLAVRRPTPRFTFGLRRAEPVAALLNAVLVFGATIEIILDGIAELRGGEPPVPDVMLVVSVGALVVNGISAWLLHDVIGHDHGHGAHAHAGHDHGAHDHDHGAHDHAKPAHDGHGHAKHGGAHSEYLRAKEQGHAMNLKGVRLHLLGDTLGSLAALVAAIVIKMGGPTGIDPVASFCVALILILGASKLLRDAILVLLEAAPRHLPVGAVRQVIEGYPGVASIHDMHVWTLGAGHDAIIVHVRSAGPEPELAARLAKRLREAFSAEYVTVQVEPDHEAAPCSVAGRESRP